eukprot:Awhi_evm1s3538
MEFVNMTVVLVAGGEEQCQGISSLKDEIDQIPEKKSFGDRWPSLTILTCIIAPKTPSNNSMDNNVSSVYDSNYNSNNNNDHNVDVCH